MTDHDLLIRIDERIGNIEGHLSTINGRITEHDKELHDEGGICDRLTTTEVKQKGNQTLIKSLWGVVVTVSLTLIGLFIKHISSPGAGI